MVGQRLLLGAGTALRAHQFRAVAGDIAPTLMSRQGMNLRVMDPTWLYDPRNVVPWKGSPAVDTYHVMNSMGLGGLTRHDDDSVLRTGPDAIGSFRSALHPYPEFQQLFPALEVLERDPNELMAVYHLHVPYEGGGTKDALVVTEAALNQPGEPLNGSERPPVQVGYGLELSNSPVDWSVVLGK